MRIWKFYNNTLNIFYNIEILNPKTSKGINSVNNTNFLLVFGDQNIDLFEINEE